MIEITRHSAIQGLSALVEEKGEGFVYTQHTGREGTKQCRYVHNGAADCMIGQFLAAQGIPLERLAEADKIYAWSGAPASELIDSLINEGLVIASDGATNVLAAAQFAQDGGMTWGEALREAISYN